MTNETTVEAVAKAINEFQSIDGIEDARRIARAASAKGDGK